MTRAAGRDRFQLAGDLSRVPCPLCGNRTLWVEHRTDKNGNPFGHALICSGRHQCAFRLPIAKERK